MCMLYMMQLQFRKCRLLNRMKMCIFFLFCLNIIFVLFSSDLQKLQKILTCFPEDKLNTIYPDLQIQKVFTPWLLMHVVILLEHRWAFESCVIVVYESLSCPQCEKMDLKSIHIVGKGSKYTKMVQNQRICGSWRINACFVLLKTV